MGSFQGSADGPEFKTIAVLSYDGESGSNGNDFIFKSFPKMTLKLTLCMGSKAFAQATYRTTSVQYLDQQVSFRQNSARNTNQLDVVYNEGWQQMIGSVVATDSDTGAKITAGSLKLEQINDYQEQGCLYQKETQVNEDSTK